MVDLVLRVPRRAGGEDDPRLPNAHLALQTLVDDVATLSAAEKRSPDPHRDDAAVDPFGETHGTTNAVMFSVALLAFRDKDLNLMLPKTPPKFVHHDLDAPPWWHVRTGRSVSTSTVRRGRAPL